MKGTDEKKESLVKLVAHLANVSSWQTAGLDVTLNDNRKEKQPLPMRNILFEDLNQHIKSNLSKHKCSKIWTIGYAIWALIGIAILSWIPNSGASTDFQITGYVLVTAALLLSAVCSAVNLYSMLNKKNKQMIQENRTTQKNMTSFFEEHKNLNKEEYMDKSVLETINKFADEASV